ncbi:MAG: c-type cytochrome [Afipia sp.]|nr:MAG: c-type cytochrome [Afipia sp.]
MAPPSAKAMLFVLATGLVLENAAARDRELGQYLSSECVTCHRPSGANAQGIPKIAGWPEDQFIAVMNAYKDKQRDNPVMQTIAGRLEAGDIAALAAYFKTQK